MSFINPFLLIGLLAVGIPLLIHLWSRRRARIIDFSHVQFLMSLHRKRVRRLKLKQILILILRMLIVALIALALARPILTNRWALAAGDRAKSSIVIILDNSYSMGYETFDGTRFDIAKKHALSLLKSLRSGDNASLILMSNIPNIVFKRLTPDIRQVQSAVEDAQLSHRSSNVWPSIWEAHMLLERADNPHKAIYLISDLGENGWQEWKNPPGSTSVADIFVVRIGDKQVENQAIENILIADEPVGIGMPMQISAKLAGLKTEAGIVEFIMDGEKSGQVIANADRISFTHVFSHPGTHIGEIRLASDRLPLDDIRHFVLDVPGQIKTLCVGDYGLYINLALNPLVSLDPEAEFSILPADCTVDELSKRSLNQYSAVILTDVSKLSGDVAEDLENYVLNGGNLVAFLGKAAEKDWYNENFSIIPAELGDRASFSQSPLKLSDWSMTHPVFSAFRSENMSGVLDSPHFYSAFSINPKPDANILASFSNNTPAILESNAGLGKVILFNASPDTAVSNLSLSPAFLPLMQQAIFYLASDAENANSNILVGGSYTRHISGIIDSPPEISSPEEGNIVPGLAATERGSRVEYGPLERSGIYKLDYKSEGSRQLNHFAVNLNTVGESNLKAAGDSEVIGKLGKRAKIMPIDNLSAEAGLELTQSGARGELSARLLIAAIILMLVEIPLANRRKIGNE